MASSGTEDFQMHLRTSLLAIGVCLTLLRPTRAFAQDVRAELLAADRAASALSSDSGLVKVLKKTLDARGVLLWPDAPVLFGAGEAQQMLLSPSGQDSTRLAWQPLGVEFATDSTMGVSWGVAVTAPRFQPGPPHIGRYTAVWHRAPSAWTISALVFMNLKTSVTKLPAGAPLSRTPIKPSGPAGPFVAADLAFARLAHDSGAVSAFRTWAAPNAFVVGGVLARGPDAIARGVEGPASWRWHPVAAGSSRLGDLGWTVGEAVISPAGEEANYSKYLTVWTRQENSIRFLTDAGNPRPAVPNPDK
jgi:hypothetical protein